MWPFTRKAAQGIETRAVGTGYTAEIMAAREAYISGRSGIGELTATVQGCVSLWEGGLALADVSGTDMLDRASLALTARALALRGEVVFLIGDDRLVPCSDWDLRTVDGRPRAYRLSVAEAGGGRSQTALAAEVLHVRIGVDPGAPWTGTAPLRRAALTAGLLQAVETALAEVYQDAPIGSAVLPFPEAPDVDLEALGRGFRGRRGRILMRESTAVAAAGGPAPVQDWKAQSVTPDLAPAMPKETLAAARDAIALAYGVLPAWLNPASAGVAIRECQRQTAQWTLAPIAALIAEEATAKLGGPVTLDVMRPLQAFDAGGRARAMSQVVRALADAKAAGVDPAQAMALVDWGDGDAA